MRKLLIVAVAIAAFVVFGSEQQPSAGKTERLPQAETYRLVHAIGNSESVSRTSMDMAACRERRDELKRVATLTGAGGSVTCSPD